ncbi:farnesol dehydrogenase-like [Culicoides brevitarsis]|uniref:farnesol dehydrogenase-like n=1 Tax=Culicoides brevitarsis TaxID=469753 RepID=UPI00307CA9C4
MEKWIHKVAVITGASTSIGQQIIKDLAFSGLTVIGITRKKHVIDAIANRHKSRGKIHALECDIADRDAIKSAFNSIEKEFGRLDVMINNAEHGTRRNEELMMNFALTGVIWCTSEAFKLMEKGKECGYIINVNGLAKKCAVKNHTETVRLDLANARNRLIRVTSLCPECIDEKVSTDQKLSPKDVSNTILYLLSTPQQINITELTIKSTGLPL